MLAGAVDRYNQNRLDMKLESSEVKRAAAKLKFRTKAFIDGQFVPASSGKTYVSVNPATGQPLARIAACEIEDVDRAVRAARRSFAQGVWCKRSPAERKQVLLRLADLLEKHVAEIALLDCLDAGKPITDCLTIDAPDTAHCFRWHAEAIDKEYEKVAPTGPGNVALIVREPLGVVGAILPWNFPIQMGAWKLGPMIEESHLRTVLAYIESGRNEGAKLVLGGRRTIEDTGGFFVEATIFDHVKPAMKIARDEIFGPVLAVFTFDREEDGVALANDTSYRLTASVYTRDVSRAHRVARALRAGTVSVNCFSEGDATTPFGGFKQSGLFGRDKSIFAHHQYTELKTVWMQLT
jgi:acyl-CoA reductase-like NAD-dependent aldehyde dehydrogenase